MRKLHSRDDEFDDVCYEVYPEIRAASWEHFIPKRKKSSPF